MEQLKQRSDIFHILKDLNKLIRLIDSLLCGILSETQSLPKGMSKFHCKEAPTISIADYLTRISKYAHCSNSVFVVALIYIDRLQQRIDGFVINKFCIHRLLICSIMVSAKFLDDFYYKNEYYAKVGGIPKGQMNVLEHEFIMQMDFDLNVTEKEFKMYTERLSGFEEVNIV